MASIARRKRRWRRGLRRLFAWENCWASARRNLTQAVLERQFEGGLAALTGAEFSRIILAYEPVWAIGTGRTATPEIAAEAHRFFAGACRGSISRPSERPRCESSTAAASNPTTYKGLMAQVEIDGALVGGASLDPQSFASIVNF